MSSLVRVNSRFAICGAIPSKEALSSLLETFKSIVYLCPDASDDFSLNDGGYQTIDALIADSRDKGHFPVTLTNPPLHSANPNLLPIHAVKFFKVISEKLEDANYPCLITCKSNRRAGMVLSTYLGIKENKTDEQILADAATHNFSYTGTPIMANFVTNVISSLGRKNKLIIRQFFEKESSTYTYLLVDSVTKDGVLIDPVLETVERDAKYINELGVNLKYVLNTHVHADHITGSGKLKGIFPEVKSVISEVSTAAADVKIQDNAIISFGSRFIRCFSTKGHTNGCFSYVLDDVSVVFTGDTLLNRGCGRTDFQSGSSKELFDSVRSILFELPDDTIVYPAHDYHGVLSSTIGEEKQFNPRLNLDKTLEEFEGIMASLQLPYPKKIDASLPANLKCGL